MTGSKPIILAMFVSLLFLQAGCARQDNTNGANGSMPTPQATPDIQAINAEITRIENDWPRIIKERDAAAVRRIEADDVVIVYPDGSVGGKEQDSKDIESGTLSYDTWDISELNVKILDSDSAVAILRITVKNGKYKAADGRSKDISGQYRLVDTYVRRNGQWQEIASATTPIIGVAATAAPMPKTSPAVSAPPAMKESPAMKPSPTIKTSPVPKPAATRRPTPSPVKSPA